MTYTLPQLLPECNVKTQHFCEACRDREGGRAFRTQILKYRGIEHVHVDFHCPKEKPWGHTPQPGAGDIFHGLIIAQYKVSACEQCQSIIASMNQLGPAGCRRHRAEILDDIWQRREQLQGWRAIAAKLPGSKLAATYELGKLFDQAVDQAAADMTTPQPGIDAVSTGL